MIEDMKGVRKVILGENTTFISQVLVGGSKVSSGIFFSNHAPIDGKIAFKGDEVIIEVVNIKGAMSYMKAIIELLKTWEINGTEEYIKSLNMSLNSILEMEMEYDK